jgi:guanylate kinase
MATGNPNEPGTGTRGKLVVISGPSGSGKTTIAREIMRRNPSLTFSVSATTRRKRENEIEGRDYFFLTREEFLKRVEEGGFVEWEELYDDYYGTLKSEIERAMANGRHLLFDVDVNGALSIKRQYPGSLLIFIRPPSLEVLRQRLMGRRTEDQAAFAKRLGRVPMELEKGNGFDFQIMNDELPRVLDGVQTIVQEYLNH